MGAQIAAHLANGGLTVHLLDLAAKEGNKNAIVETALDIYRSEQLIRQFPYADWQNWRIFWHRVPILFYFKEVKSIHFLPILFDPKMLETCLERHCPLKS